MVRDIVLGGDSALDRENDAQRYKVEELYSFGHKSSPFSDTSLFPQQYRSTKQQRWCKLRLRLGRLCVHRSSCGFTVVESNHSAIFGIAEVITLLQRKQGENQAQTFRLCHRQVR